MKKIIVPAAIAALGLVTMAPAADAATVKQVRQSDFVAALSDTRATGHFEFLAEGIHIWTEGNTSTDKVAEYFPVTGALPATSKMAWIGTSPQPGVQIVFDVDATTGNGNDFNILVGEPVYGTDGNGNYTDWWLSNGSSATAKAADPSGAGDDAGCGCGSTLGIHGTLAGWKAALPQARMLAGGFSLGSGVEGDGVVRSINYDDTTYQFTSDPAVVTKDVTGNVVGKVKGKSRQVKLTLTSDKLAAGTTQGKALEWKIVVDGSTAAQFTQNADEVTKLSYKFTKNTGTHKVKVFKNGVKVETFKVKTTPKKK